MILNHALNTKFRIVEAFGEQLRKCFDRDQGVSDFVRHARCQVAPEGRPVGQVALFLQGFLGRQVLHQRDRAERVLLGTKPPDFN